MDRNNEESKQIIISKLEQLQKDIFHSTDEIFFMDVSADKKAKISVMKFELLSDLQKLTAEIKRI